MLKLLSTAFSAVLLSSLALGCNGDETDISEFEYGRGQPGEGQPEGGEALLEYVKLAPELTGFDETVDVTWFYAVRFTGDNRGSFRAPVDTWTEVRNGDVYPVGRPLVNMEWIDWGDSIHLTGPGVDEEIEKTLPPEGALGVRDNRANPDRVHDFVYGGPVSDWQRNTEMVPEPGETYTLETPDGDFDMVFAPGYEAPEGIGTEIVKIPGDEDFTLTYEAVPQPDDSLEHTPTTHFTFLAFGDLDIRGPTAAYMYVASPENDGEITVPTSVLDDLNDQGIIQHGRFTHEEHLIEGRRFDTMTIYCSIGLYHKE